MPAALPLAATRTARRRIEAHEADRTKIPIHARHGQELPRSIAARKGDAIDPSDTHWQRRWMLGRAGRVDSRLCRGIPGDHLCNFVRRLG